MRVRATTVNRTDCGFRKAQPFIVRLFSGLVRPKRRILGTEFAGVVEEVGRAVTRFRTGDDVFGVNADRFGAHAELVCVRQDGPISVKPTELGYEDAAAVCDGAVLAHTYLRRAGLQPGQPILIYGASGSIGTAAVQMARHFHLDVTAVCSTKDVGVVGSLGADRVIDYTREDFTEHHDAYDAVFDAVGKLSFKRCRRSLRPSGLYLSTDLGPWQQNPLLALLTSVAGTRKVAFPVPRYTQAEVEFVKGLIEAGEYRAVVDRRYPLDQVVEATRYVETEQKTGNVVLTVT